MPKPLESQLLAGLARGMTSVVHVIGGGLAGSEAAWQLAERGVEVALHEMRPLRQTDAHQTQALAARLFQLLPLG